MLAQFSPVPRPARAWLRSWCWAVGVMLAALAGSGCKPSKPVAAQPVVVRFQRAKPAEQVQSRSLYVGILRGDPETDLSFRVNGILDRIGPEGSKEDWREGVAVVHRQPLAQLKQEDFVSAVDEAEARLTLTEAVFQRTERLRSDQTVSPQELDVARANRDSARAMLRKAKEALTDSRIYAPYDGFLLARLASAGETLMPGRTVLRIADLRTNVLEVGIPDTLVSQIRTHMNFKVAVSAFEGIPFTGRVSEVGVAAREGTRLFRVVVKIPNNDAPHVLRPGMSATVDFGAALPPPPGAVAVPLSALMTSTGGAGRNSLAVFVVDPDNQTVRERRVETGDILRSSVIITTNLKAGEKVVTFGVANLHDGASVEAIEENGHGKE